MCLVEKNGNFAIGEYTHALRLASELAELRAGYANPYSVAEPWSVFFRGNNKTAYVSYRHICCFGTPNGNRTHN